MFQLMIVPVTKTKSAETHSGHEDSAEDNKKRNMKTLAQDFKTKLSFLKRRNSETSINSVRPSPEEAQKWSFSFADLMSSKYGSSLFRAFLAREFCEENLEFWLACEDFKKSRPNKLPSKAKKIFNDFVAVQAPKEVNLDHKLRTTIMNSLENPDLNAFDQAQRRIQGLMEQDAYRRFLQSNLYLELLQKNESM